jgi:hypothetical protein
MNRLTYDTCAYEKELKQSTTPLQYMLDPVKFENCQKCRMELGVVGGTAVSHITGNLVDLENDLRNQTRPNTHCPSYKFNPVEPLGGKEYIKPVLHPKINDQMLHLKPCQMVDYKAVPLPAPLNLFRCGLGGASSTQR